MKIPSPINVSARWIARKPQRTQVRMVEAFICLYVAIFVTMVTIGVGLTFADLFRP